MAKPLEIDERQFFMREITAAKKSNEELKRHVSELSRRTIETSERLEKANYDAILAHQKLAEAKKMLAELKAGQASRTRKCANKLHTIKTGSTWM